MAKEIHTTDGTQQPPFKDKAKSALYHMADGAYNSVAVGVVAAGVAGVGAVGVVAVGVVAGVVAGVGVVAAGVVAAGAAGTMDSLRKYKNTLPKRTAQNWKNTGTGLLAAFSLATGLAAAIATHNHITDDAPQMTSPEGTTEQTVQTRQYSLTGPADADFRLKQVFGGSGLKIVNDNNKPAVLYTAPQGCQLTAKPTPSSSFPRRA